MEYWRSQENIQLLKSAKNGDISGVSNAIVKGAKINAHTNTTATTALMFASKGGYIKIVKLLLAHGANVNAQTKFKSNTALMFASKGGYIKIVELLLAHGADIKVLLQSLNVSQLRRVYQKVYGKKCSAKTKREILKLLHRK